jgi:2-C-methyl-D-erythritol 4-phosphate cytidylyltransferase
MPRVAALIVAAGSGRRFGSAKQFAMLKGKTLVEWCLAAFDSHPGVSDIVLVLPAADLRPDLGRAYSKVRAVVPGGSERQDSVRQGFARLDRRATDVVLVHDGVRPLVGADLIGRVIDAAAASGAAVPGLALDETVKEVEGSLIRRTIDRSGLARVQTPQGFAFAVLEEALASADGLGFRATDEAMLVERLGRPVTLVPGEPRNIKVTTPLDLKLAEVLLEA